MKWLLAVVLMTGLAACGGTATPGSSTAPDEPPLVASPSPLVTIAASAGPGPTQPAPSAPPSSSLSAASEPLLSGDAATNASCQLATTAEIEEHVAARVVEMRGLTGPGAYGEQLLSCAWYLDSTDIGIPSVLVQWEYPVTQWHDPVVDLHEMQIEQGLASPVPGIGDSTILQGRTAETVAGERIVRVTVLMHVEPTEADQANAIALLELMLPTAKP